MKYRYELWENKYILRCIRLNFKRIERRVSSAIELLRIKDFYLLKNNVNERSITHKLAEHLQYVIGNEFDVDCEYNRNIDDDSNCKKIYLFKSKIEKISDFTGKKFKLVEAFGDKYCELSVFPDIIVHKRGRNTENLLAIEVKKSTSNITNEYDFLKLRNYTDPTELNNLRYKYGVFIRFEAGKEKYEAPEIAWFKDGEKFEV